MSTLWDLVRGLVRPAAKPAVRRAPSRPARAKPRRPRTAGPAQERYDAVTRAMLDLYGVRVRRWRKAMSGIAWEVHYRDGSVTKLIEAPRPKGPMSVAVFLHEIGHHAIGLGAHKPRCLEEFHAWKFALERMEEEGLNITDAVRRRVHASLHYAVAKARRRGLQSLPDELKPYTQPPPRTRHGKTQG